LLIKTKRSGHAAAAVQRKGGEWCVAVLGGYDAKGLLSATDGLWLFNPTSKTWQQAVANNGCT
jgi:hypothetical protein